MRIGSLFSGYAGLDMGIQAVLGGNVVWHSDIDAGACRILAHHWPDVPNLGNIAAVNWSQVEPVDVLTGGFPCQDVSLAGRRAGMIRDGDGRTRSGLWGEMLKAIDELRPNLVVAENVRGLLSAKADSNMEYCPWCMGDERGNTMRALGAVLADLASIGYDAQWYSLRAADVGAPHGRFRVFVIAYPANPDGIRRERRERTWGRRTGPENSDSAPLGSLLPTPVVNDMGEGKTVGWWDQWTAAQAIKHGNNGHGNSLAIEALRLLPTPEAKLGAGGGSQAPAKRRAGGHAVGLNDVAEHLLPTPKASNNENRQSEGYGRGKDGNFHELVSGESDWGKYEGAITRWEPIIGRPAPAPTETSAKGKHRLSSRFVEWMMGLPDGHVTNANIWGGMSLSAARNAQLKALGNGVVPQQAAAAITRFITTDWENMT